MSILLQDVDNGVGCSGGTGLPDKRGQRRNPGSGVAGAIAPLTDASSIASFEDVVADTIHPWPKYRLRRIDIEAGFILVVEVLASAWPEIYMAADGRFYRRAEQRVVRMSESEVREAYTRIAISRMRLEETIERTTEAELAQLERFEA